MKRSLLLPLFLLLWHWGSAQLDFDSQQATLQNEHGTVYGTMLIPNAKPPVPVALLIAGSGPTDRDGNNAMMKNNSLKLLAEGLARQGIASLRYDKRGIAASGDASGEEIDLRFEDFVEDATNWVKMLKKDKRFSKVTVVGHSQGSLIGMMAVQRGKADAFVSLAGPGIPGDKLIERQIRSQPKFIQDASDKVLASLRKGQTEEEVPPILFSLYRPSIQPYIISWMQYDPAKEIKKLTVPVLIVQGNNDLQIGVADAKTLRDAKPGAELLIIEKMNHVFKEYAGNDRMENMKLYNEPEIPVMPALVQEVTRFILER